VAAVLALLVLVPASNLAYQAGRIVRQVEGAWVPGWSGTRCLELLIPWPATYRFAAVWEFRQEFFWTGVTGVTAATLAVLVASPLAWMGRRGGPYALPAIIVAAAGISTMGPLVGVALIRLFSLSDQAWVIFLYDQTIVAPVLAVTWRCLPMTILICWFAFAGLSRNLLDTATLDGAGPWTRFVRLAVTQRGPALALAWFVALAMAGGELSASILVLPPGMTTVPLRVFGLLHSGVTNQAAAICLTSILGFLVIAALVQGLARSWLGTDWHSGAERVVWRSAGRVR
jgi:iron(III) transport system permease protein